MNTLPTRALLLASTAAVQAGADEVTLYDGSSDIGFRYIDFEGIGVVTDTGSSVKFEVTKDADGSAGLFGMAGDNLSSPETFPAEGNLLRVVYKFGDENEASMFKVVLTDKDDAGAGEQYKFNVEPDMDDATEVEGGFSEILLPLGEGDADSRTEGKDAGFSKDGDGVANHDVTQWSIQSVWGQASPLVVEIQSIEIVPIPEP